MSAEITITLDRVDCTYRAGERLSGMVFINASKTLSHNGLVLVAEGKVELIPSPKALDGMFASAPTKASYTMQQQLFLIPSGKLQAGETKVPFEFQVKANNVGDAGLDPSVLFCGKLFETYRGVYINVQYSIHVRLARGLMTKDDVASQEFMVICPTTQNAIADASRLVFKLSPSTLLNQKVRDLLFLFSL